MGHRLIHCKVLEWLKNHSRLITWLIELVIIKIKNAFQIHLEIRIIRKLNLIKIEVSIMKNILNMILNWMKF